MVLEELGLKYETKHIDISKNVQKEEWYLKINRTITLLPSPFPFPTTSPPYFLHHSPYPFPFSYLLIRLITHLTIPK